jgi:hypothetical protein
MERKKYFFEVTGVKNKELGVIDGGYLTSEEMVEKAKGILAGVKLVKTFVTVRVREDDKTKYCYVIN